ncbi:SulP family inorganic anion transporter [Corynebacterium accolens]|uniref:SulP family inorganic anion transporter n=1 Tax=Corynebacterium accolens TaxID=38284 RepID=UPI002543A542|nr:SulP family inorganic anion transporter [Corynebacterium accolens]MDK4324622.1 SulP family inorganic anion transporter [Corynebacterium accolens]
MINEQPAPTGVIASFRFAFSSPARLRKEVLGGLAVALALIPEVLSFSILAGLDPRVGLYSSVIMAMAIAFTGGRPAMISAAAGAVALVVAPLAHEYGHDYVVAAVLVAGIIQVLLAWVGIAKLMRFIPRSVMTGFVNALGIMMFTAQLPHLIDVPWMVYVLVAIGLAIMIILPRFTQAIPAPLVTIVVVSIIAVAAGWKVPDVADQGELPTTLPGLFIPDIPWNLETLQIIAPYAFGMALVGLMESLLTAKLVDDITDTHSDKTRESFGQGIGNILAAAIGGMGVCAMIGQTMIGVKVSQARTRLSTFLAGAFLLVLCLLFGEAVGRIPMAALVAVMILVAATTVNWHSIRPRTLKLMPLSEILVMLLTVAGTLATHNLAVGVVLGVVAASIGFARRVAHLVEVELVDGYTYVVHGQLFFASSNDLVYAFDYTLDTDFVVVDLTDAEVWDASTVATLDAVQKKYADRGIEVEFRGLDGASAQRLERLSGQLGD